MADPQNYQNGTPNTTVTNRTQSVIGYLKELGYQFDKEATEGQQSNHVKSLGNEFTFNLSEKNFKDNNGVNAWNSKDLSFDNTENPNDQNYYVYLYHAVRTDHQYKSVKERVSYYYENGPKQGQPVPDRFQPKDYDLYFVRTQDVDLVTGAKKD
ncbi:hypothetical protein [Lactobacillus gallinarum]|uniref:hypothetical protein n=1 Tax=Lactobacillus gallinarum TaxID=52242 RepID=UPI00248ED3FC|nr:hypothetical protein [Lactobacillus gallinarum]